MTSRDTLPVAVWASVGAALLASGFGLAGLPLLEAPGWELAMAGALAAARRELAGPAPSAVRAFGRAATATTLAQGALLAGATARTALLSPCSAGAGLAFLPVVALPSALLAAALGTAAGFASGGRRLAATLLYAVVALAGLGLSLWEAWRGPAAYVLDHLLGSWPGPLYDEALAVDRRLVLYRLGTLAWTAGVVAAAALLARRRPPRPRAAAAAALVLSLGAAGALRLVATSTGDRADRTALDRILGGRRTGARCDLHHPAEKPAADVERVLRDCELDATEVAAALGLEHPPRIAVWLHRSAGERQRLTGAGRTDFTKPWLGEVHVLDAPGGPSALRHELVHALAGTIAGGPLAVPARAGLWVNMGLVEGLAVALELPRGEWTSHEWARAMRELGLLPAAARLVEPAGFFAAPPSRAYAAAGSLLEFLLARYGAAPVRRAYAGATVEEAFGRPLPVLEADWQAFLDGIPVPPELRAAAQSRFGRGGLLARRCVREVAGLESSAVAAQRDGRSLDAAILWRRAAALSGDASHLRAAGDALRLSDPAAAERAWTEALEALGPGGDQPALRATLLESLGDRAWRAGDGASATVRYRAALGLRPDRPQARLLQAKVAAAGDPALAGAAPWLLAQGDPGLALARLAALDHPLAAYLLGRAALARGAPRLAAERLARAIQGDLPSPAFRVEALRSLGEARCAAGDPAGAASAFDEAGRTAEREADRVRALALARRCDAEWRTFGPPPAGPSDGLPADPAR